MFHQHELFLFAGMSTLLPKIDPGRGLYNTPSTWQTFSLRPRHACCQEGPLQSSNQRTFYLIKREIKEQINFEIKTI